MTMTTEAFEIARLEFIKEQRARFRRAEATRNGAAAARDVALLAQLAGYGHACALLANEGQMTPANAACWQRRLEKCLNEGASERMEEFLRNAEERQSKKGSKP